MCSVHRCPPALGAVELPQPSRVVGGKRSLRKGWHDTRRPQGTPVLGCWALSLAVLWGSRVPHRHITVFLHTGSAVSALSERPRLLSACRVHLRACILCVRTCTVQTALTDGQERVGTRRCGVDRPCAPASLPAFLRPGPLCVDPSPAVQVPHRRLWPAWHLVPGRWTPSTGGTWWMQASSPRVMHA